MACVLGLRNPLGVALSLLALFNVLSSQVAVAKATSGQAGNVGAGRQEGSGPRGAMVWSKEERVGNRTFHPSFGLYPKGCRWRMVTTDNSSQVDYQYWDFALEQWSDEQPAACVPTTYPDPGPPDWKWHNNTPRTEVSCQASHCVYTNMYYNNGRWYALVDGELFIPSWRFSRNQEVVPFHVIDAKEFVDAVKWRLVPGDTILFDFIFFIHPTAIGHWWEMLGPLYRCAGGGVLAKGCGWSGSPASMQVTMESA